MDPSCWQTKIPCKLRRVFISNQISGLGFFLKEKQASWWFFTNPFEKIWSSNWIISPNFRDEHTKIFELPPPRQGFNQKRIYTIGLDEAILFGEKFFVEQKTWKPKPGKTTHLHGTGFIMVETISPRKPQHTPGAYPRPPQTPKWNEFLHKLLVLGLGYVPGVCWKILRISQI